MKNVSRYNINQGGEDDLKRKITFSLLAFTFVCGFFYAMTSYATSTVETKGKMNVRSGPGLTYDVIDTLQANESLTVLDEQDEWFHVSYKKDREGWVASWLVERKSDVESKGDVVISTTDGLNVRLGPSTQSNIIGKMDAGKEATLELERDGWSYIIVDGMYGWVHSSYLTKMTSETQKANNAVNPSPEAKDGQFTVIVDSLNVRSRPGLQGKVIGYAHQGEAYKVLEVDHNWVKIQLDSKKSGWVASFHGQLNASPKSGEQPSLFLISTIADGTNFRKEPTTHSPIVKRLEAGYHLNVLKEEGDWYEVEIDGQRAYVAQWVVSTLNSPNISKRTDDAESTVRKKASIPGTLNGITIVLDPGHGGHDRGTTGARGTREKDLTMKTAEVLALKLRSAGAKVHLTRERDTFIPLRTRAQMKSQMNADAFISIHYDANVDSTVVGHTTFYFHDNQKELADVLNATIEQQVPLRNRGVQVGNFQVLNENSSDAVLLELGFLTNAAEEQVLLSSQFRETVSYGIYDGLLQFFND